MKLLAIFLEKQKDYQILEEQKDYQILEVAACDNEITGLLRVLLIMLYIRFTDAYI
jgi:hypothetical protein